MADKRTQEIILKYSVDERTISDANSRLAALLDNFDNIVTAAKQTDLSAANAGSGLQSMANDTEKLTFTVRESETAVRRQAAALMESAEAARNYGSAASAAGSSIGARDTALDVSRLLGGSNLPGLSQAGDVIGSGVAIADAVEGLGRLKPALRGIAEQAAAGISSFTGLEVGVGAVAAGAGLLVVGLAAVMVAIEAWKVANEQAVQAIENWIAGAERADAFLRGQPTTDQAADQLADWNAEIQDNQARIDLLKTSYGQLTTNMGVFTHVVDLLDMGGVQTMRTEWERLEEENQALNISIGEVINAQGQGKIAATDLAAKEAELAELRASIAVQQIDALIKKEQEAARERYQQGIEDLNMRRKYADFERSLREVGDVSGKVSDLKTASANRIAGMNEAFSDFLAKAEQRIADVNADLGKRKGELERDYMQQSLKDTESYLKQEQRAREDYQRDRVRAIQDMYDSMLSAEESNDVIAFIQAQRAGEKRIKQLDEDASVEAKRRSEEFVILQKERREQLKKQLADIQTAANERIAAIRREVNERRTLLARQIAEERAALTQRINDAYLAAKQEIALRKQQFAASLAQEQQYATARLALERQLQQNLLAIVSQYSSSKAISAATAYKTSSGVVIPSTSAYAMPSASTLSKSSGTTNVNISMGNIGSTVTRTEVTSQLNDLARILSGTIVNSYGGGGSGSFGITA